MKLMIAVPTMDFVHVEFMKSLVKLIERLKDDGIQYELCIDNGTLVYHARNHLSYKAVREEFTHVLWLDSDMVFEPEVLDDLLFAHKPIVSGIAHSRRRPFTCCLFADLDLNTLKRADWTQYREPFQVAGCGMACTLMSVDVLRDVVAKYGEPFTPMKSYGEDLAFCVRAHELGYEVWADPDVRVGHIGHLTIWPDEVQKWNEIIH